MSEKYRYIRTAATFFLIGYASIVGLFVSLGGIPASLRSIITFVMTCVIFSELALRYFTRMKTDNSELFGITIRLSAFWAFLSLAMDVLLMVVIMPLISYGELQFTFFEQQSDLYWYQFPMFFVSGFFANMVYSKIASISSSTSNN